MHNILPQGEIFVCLHKIHVAFKSTLARERDHVLIFS